VVEPPRRARRGRWAAHQRGRGGAAAGRSSWRARPICRRCAHDRAAARQRPTGGPALLPSPSAKARRGQRDLGARIPIPRWPDHRWVTNRVTSRPLLGTWY
jgi:hypothetical protein